MRNKGRLADISSTSTLARRHNGEDLGEGYVRKRTTVMTNSREVAKRINVKCDGTHRHVHLLGEGRKGINYIRVHSAGRYVKA